LIESIGPESLLVVIDGWMSKRVRQASTPEDILQETLVRAWTDREHHEWASARAYRAWLLTIARHRVVDVARRLRAEIHGGRVRVARFSELEASETVSDATNLLPAWSVTPSRCASHRERAEAMILALSRLDRESQFLVRLRLFEELPMSRIAQRLGIPIATAWYRFHKAAQAYAKEFQSILPSRS